MSNGLMEQDSVQNKKNTKKKGLMIALIIFLILFLLTTAILSSQLYKMATRDKYTVDLQVGEMESEIELFRIEYENENKEVTVQGVNGESVVAPGTTVNYDIRLRNNDDVIIDFLLAPKATYLDENYVPVQFRIIDSYGNYVLGDEQTWVTVDELNELNHKGSIHPGEVFTYHVSWQWIFEVSDEQNAIDTYLGNQLGDIRPGVSVSINTESVANPTPVKSNKHMMHLWGDGFGCCWCCWLVWLWILVSFLLLIWVWKLRKKIDEMEETIEKYEESMKFSSNLFE